jgi:RNase H-fold protein (predicted Holliday junction resolvase)
MNQISSKQFRILAVTPSTRGLGFVVMEGEKTIIECATRVADGNEKDKNAQSVTKLKKLLDSYQPGVVVLQDMEAKGSRRAPRIKKLNRQIKAVAEKRKIQVKLISGTQMRNVLLGNPKGTKQEMAEMLAAQFPDELASRLPPKRKAWDSEDDRMDIFDAVALAVALRLKQAKRQI